MNTDDDELESLIQARYKHLIINISNIISY